VKTVTYTATARRAFRKLAPETQAVIATKLARYAELGAGDAKALRGSDGARLRVGDFRVIFVETRETIEVRAVGHRRDIYR
jgi:mRNA interferase RelE/StbE